MSAAAGSEANERLVHETTSLCRVCKNAVPASVWANAAGEIWMRKACGAHGAQAVRLSADAAWYERTRAVRAVDGARDPRGWITAVGRRRA